MILSPMFYIYNNIMKLKTIHNYNAMLPLVSLLLLVLVCECVDGVSVAHGENDSPEPLPAIR